MIFSYFTGTWLIQPFEELKRQLLLLNGQKLKLFWPDQDEIGSLVDAYNETLMMVQVQALALADQEKELREFMIYQTPGWGGIWSEFETERARLRKEQEAAEREAKKPLSWRFIRGGKLLTNTRSGLWCWSPYSSGSLSLSV